MRLLDLFSPFEPAAEGVINILPCRRGTGKACVAACEPVFVYFVCAPDSFSVAGLSLLTFTTCVDSSSPSSELGPGSHEALLQLLFFSLSLSPLLKRVTEVSLLGEF